jgi:hypothetical protein
MRTCQKICALDQGGVSQSNDSVGERHLRRTIAAFIDHYHHERNHQGLRNELIDPVFHGGAMATFVAARDSVGSSTTTTARRDGFLSTLGRLMGHYVSVGVVRS